MTPVFGVSRPDLSTSADIILYEENLPPIRCNCWMRMQRWRKYLKRQGLERSLSEYADFGSFCCCNSFYESLKNCARAEFAEFYGPVCNHVLYGLCPLDR